MSLEVLFVEFAEAHLDIESRSGTEWNIRCPIHGESHASMRFNIEKGVFYCHGCGVRGTAASLAKFLGVPFTGGQDQESQMAILRAKLSKLIKVPDDVAAFVPWPESRLQRYKRFSTPYWTDLPPTGRGFTPEIVDVFDLGYDPMEAHAIIPIRDEDGAILGVTRRDLTSVKRSYKDPKHFVKGENLFGSWLVKQSREHYVVLCEGPLDAVKIWQSGHPAVAQYGSKLTPNQIRLLKMLGVTTVILAYDNDVEGRKCADYAMGWRTVLNRHGRPTTYYIQECDLRNFFVVKTVTYNSAVKDPGDMEDSDLSAMICAASYVGYSVE